MRAITLNKNNSLEIGTFSRPEFPASDSGWVRIKTKFSCVSWGTESLLIRTRKSNPSPDSALKLGYSASGVVTETNGNSRFQEGDRVAVYGAPYVFHADELVVPESLCLQVPENVGLDAAATVGLGAIAVHSVHLACHQLGEITVVQGLGLLGILIAELAAASGQIVIGTDLIWESRRDLIDNPKVTVTAPEQVKDLISSLLLQFGAPTPGKDESSPLGADAVIAAAACSDPNHLDEALEWCRQRGRIVIVGHFPINLNRDKFFHKEISVEIAKAAGPGRYDRQFETGQTSYPFAYVRWTETTNMGAYLWAISAGHVFPMKYITHVVDFEDAPRLYTERPEDSVGILFKY